MNRKVGKNRSNRIGRRMEKLRSAMIVENRRTGSALASTGTLTGNKRVRVHYQERCRDIGVA